MSKGEPLLSVEGLEKHFPVTRGVFGRVVGQVRAVDGVSFDIAPGETLGLVGESGCGKTTAGRAILRLIEPTGGTVRFDGQDLSKLDGESLRRMRRNMQIIFQDPFSSLNPRMRIRDIVGEALQVHGVLKGRELEAKVGELLEKVGVGKAFVNRYPHEFSGGQRQRIGIARAIALNPKLIVCDEAVSALDVSIRAQVLNLLIELREELSLSYLFISHDLSVVKHISSRIAVMYLGQIVEIAPADELFAKPAHPYTRALLSAIPLPDPRKRQQRTALTGDVPTPLDPPSGCRFHTRCPAVLDRCKSEEPELYQLGSGHRARCFHAEGLTNDSEWFESADARITKAEIVVISERESVHPSAKLPSPSEPTTMTEPLDLFVEPPRSGGIEKATRAVAIVGIALTLAGHWLLGPFVLLACHGLVLRRTYARPVVSDGLVVLALVVSFVLSSVLSLQAKRYEARRELSQLADQIVAFRATHGSDPKDLSELGWRLFEIFDEGTPRDPWGRSYEYTPPKAPGAPPLLRSAGPDPTLTDDDLVKQF